MLWATATCSIRTSRERVVNRSGTAPNSEQGNAAKKPCGLRPAQQAVQREDAWKLRDSQVRLREEIMRNWCATVVLGALLALPLCAQQKDASTAGKSNEKVESTSAASATASDFSIAPASRTL